MKEIVKKIMETEREVRERIETAREEAQRIVREAEKKSRELTEEHRQRTTRDAQEMVERMKREAEAEKTLQIEKVKGGSHALIEKRSTEIERAVGRIVGVVLGTEK